MYITWKHANFEKCNTLHIDTLPLKAKKKRKESDQKEKKKKKHQNFFLMDFFIFLWF